METPDRKMKQADEIFCWSCGEPIKKEAVICIRCGVQTRPLIPQGNTASPSFGAQSFPASLSLAPKSKTIAVLLAVFLSYWTWLYTFKRDGKKFTGSLALSLLVPLLWVSCVVANYCYGAFGWSTYRLFEILAILGLFGFWIWAIILSSVRSKSWYSSYPNG
jgi:hypothetical protein